MLDQQESQGLLVFKDLLDHQAHRAKEVSWVCLATRDHKVLEDIEENQEFQGQRELKVKEYRVHQEYQVLLDHQVPKVKMVLVPKELLGLQDPEVTLV